jgi:hypothetical protein
MLARFLFVSGMSRWDCGFSTFSVELSVRESVLEHNGTGLLLCCGLVVVV